MLTVKPPILCILTVEKKTMVKYWDWEGMPPRVTVAFMMKFGLRTLPEGEKLRCSCVCLRVWSAKFVVTEYPLRRLDLKTNFLERVCSCVRAFNFLSVPLGAWRHYKTLNEMSNLGFFVLKERHDASIKTKFGISTPYVRFLVPYLPRPLPLVGASVRPSHAVLWNLASNRWAGCVWHPKILNLVNVPVCRPAGRRHNAPLIVKFAVAELTWPWPVGPYRSAIP